MFTMEGKNMTTWFISRHAGAKAWAEEEGFAIDKIVEHFDPSLTQQGDKVLGSLPIHLAAEVCARGGVYYHLSLNRVETLRGKELTSAEMRVCDARLEAYVIRQRE